MHLREEDCKGWLLKDIGNAGAERSRKNQTSNGPRILWNVNTSRVLPSAAWSSASTSMSSRFLPLLWVGCKMLQCTRHGKMSLDIRSLTTFRQGKAIQSQGALDTKAQSVSSGYGVSWASTSVAHCTLHFFLFSIWTSSSQRSSIIKSQWEWKVCEAKCWQH